MPGLIAHEWLEPRGGAEVVVAHLLELFPDADLLSLWNHDRATFPTSRVRETWLRTLPAPMRKPAAALLSPALWRATGTRRYDWVLCSSHLFAHHARARGALPGATAPKYVYAHTPARYVWAPEIDERGQSLPARLARPLIKPLDRRRAKEPVAIAAVSRYVADRISRAWNRNASVIHPPVRVEDIIARPPESESLTDSERRVLGSLPTGFLLGASRFVAYKRLDLVVEAAERLGAPVVIAGGGPLAAPLRSRISEARVPAVIVDSPSTPMLHALYARASAFVFPPIEDFGIMPVEAMATGTPAVVNGQGGAREIIERAGGGVAFEEPTASSIAQAVEKAVQIDSATARANARLFDSSVFESAMTQFVTQHQ